MALADTRAFLEKLQASGELVVIDREIDWDIQAAAIVAKLTEEGGPAVWFKRIKGYPEGFSLAGGLFAGAGLLHPRKRKPWTRISLGLGVDPEVTYEDFVFTINDRSKRGVIKPLQVSEGRCKDVVITGDDVDIVRFPIPQVHPTDGGRYGAGIVTVKDPDTHALHLGSYRWMVLGKNRLTCNFPDDRPISAIFRKYQERGADMPFAIVYGGNPALQVASHMNLPATADTLGIAGGLCQDPIELVKSETGDLLVPADADIVLEGEFSTSERAAEGPYPTFIDLGTVTEQPVGTVRVITHRRNPIVTFGVETSTGCDSMNLTSLLHSAELTAITQTANLPVRWIQLPIEMRLGMCFVSTKVEYNGFPYQLSGLLFGSSNWFDKLVVVDYDTNPEQLNVAVNDMINKANPVRGWYRSDVDAPVNRVAKYPAENGMTSHLYVQATWEPTVRKEDRGQLISFETCYPPEIQERVLARWNNELGFKEEPVLFRRVTE